MTGLGDYAFNELSKVTSVSLPDSLETLGVYCFSSCNSLASIDVPDSVTELGGSCFAGCAGLAEVRLPAGLKALPYALFNGCSSLSSVSIPEGITDLSAGYVFNGCSSLTSLYLPSSITAMGAGENAFAGAGITDIYFAGTLSQWLGIEFAGTVSGLPMQQPCNLYISGERLTALTIPDDISQIPDYAFQYVRINSLAIPENVTGIGRYAFRDSSVQSILMSDSVTNIDTYAFAECENVKKVYFVGDESAWSGIDWNGGNYAIQNSPRKYIDSFSAVRPVTVQQAGHGKIALSDFYCAPGDTVTVTITPEVGWMLKSIIVNGEPINGTSFVAEEGVDYTVTAEFMVFREAIDEGTIGENINWVLYEDYELYIYGSGEIVFDGSGVVPWYNYRANIKSVVIDEDVTSVGHGAFGNCSSLASVSLPEGLIKLDADSFRGCSSLRILVVPSSVEYIGNAIFLNANLDALYYSGSIYDWLKIEFYYSYFLSNVDKLYIEGEMIEDLIIPDGVEYIPDYAFKSYSRLKSVVIPSSVKRVGGSVFEGCNNLVYAEFLGDAPTIGGYAFNTNTNFTIYYHSGAHGWSSPKWDEYYAACVEEFSDYSALDEDNRNSQGVLFTLNDTSMTAIVGDGSDEYNNSGYYGAQKGAVKIPDVVTKGGKIYTVIGAGNNAFARNRHVTSVSIGSGVTSIIPSAFMGCPELESINVSEDNEYYSSDGGVLYDAEKLYLYVYPGGKADESFTVPETVRTVGMYSFYDNEHIRSLYVGANVTSVYEYAFCGLSNLAEITLPFIGTSAESTEDYFYFHNIFGGGNYCNNCLGYWDYSAAGDRILMNGSLKRVSILGGELYSSAFSSCGSLEEINLPQIPDSIPSGCFDGCISLNKVTFAGNSCNEGEIILPEGIKSIDAGAFTSCQSINYVTIPASLTIIENGAFSGAGIEEFTVADGNPSYSTDEWGVLYNKDKSALIQYPACRQWPYYNVAATTTKIESQAFSGCNTLVNLYIPNTVTAFAELYSAEAIVDCPNLTICCFSDAAAARYARTNGLTAWYMDNKTLQGIRVYSLPEQAVQTEGAVDFSGLYIVGDYGGKELQIDNYTLSYDGSSSGLKTVTVEYMGRTVTFEMVFYTSEAGNVISFRTGEDLDGKVAMIAVYNSEGAMLLSANAAIINGEAQIGVSDEVFAAADHAKLLILDEATYAPAAAAQETSV